MSHSVEKLITFCEKTYDIETVLLQDGQEKDVLPHLGSTRLIVYTGKNQEEFNELCGTYKPAPTRGAVVYHGYDFGKDIIAIGSMKPHQLYETIESFIPSDVRSSSTRPPQVHFDQQAETPITGDCPHDSFKGEETKIENKRWNPNKFFRG